MTRMTAEEQWRVLADLLTGNGLPPNTTKDDLDPSLFDAGEARLAILACKTGADPRTEIAPTLSPAFLRGLFPTEPERTSPNYLTWADLDLVLGDIAWDWQDWLPRGFLTLVAASQEAGKSILALRIAGCYIMGWPWPDGTEFTGERGCVLWAEGEAGQQLNLSRAKAWGLDLMKIVTPHEEIADFQFGNAEHREHLWGLYSESRIKFGVIDSLSGIHGGRESDAEMQRIIQPFAALARDENKPLIMNHHLSKPPHGQADVLTLNRVRGSGTITQTARLVWGIDRPDKEQSETRRLAVLKSNLGIKPQPLGFAIGDAGIVRCEAPRESSPETQTDKAVDLLMALLRKRPMKQAAIREEAEGAAIGWRTMNTAKKRLQIISKRQLGVWWWGLPGREEYWAPGEGRA